MNNQVDLGIYLKDTIKNIDLIQKKANKSMLI